MKAERLTRWILAVALTTAFGCGDAEATSTDTPDDPAPDGGGNPGPDEGGTPVDTSDDPVTEDHGDGTFTTQLDATSEEDWVYWDLDTNTRVSTDDPQNDPTWDVGVQRFKIITNGGSRGSGGVLVAVLAGEDFATLGTAPVDGYQDSAEGEEDSDGAPVEILGWDWYDYDPINHVLSTKGLVYVIRSTDGAYYKLDVLGYYDEFGTPGFVSFMWGGVNAPEAP